MLQDTEIPTREQAAKEEMACTSVSSIAACILTAVFVAVLFAVPVIERLDDARCRAHGLAPSPVAADYGLVAALRSAADVYRASEGDGWGSLWAANRTLMQEFKRVEENIETGSWLVRWIQPHAQYVMTRRLGAGNRQVYPGRYGWLFYRPDVDYVTGRGFLDPATLRRRQAEFSDSDGPVQSDPVPAILDFDRQLRSRGIRLIVMPVPAKPSIYPYRLHAAWGTSRLMPDNPSYEPFVRRLLQSGILVFDSRRAIHRVKGEESYLRSDTHWRPETVERVAGDLAQKIRETGLLPERETMEYRRDTLRLSGQGDTARLLRLPAYQRRYPLEAVELSQVRTPDGRLWNASPEADILILGDSYANYFSLPGLGWGGGAGLVEQVSFHLQRPVDRITMNDQGAHTTRRELARLVSGGVDRLNGKRVVVWEFAVRELATGHWPVITLDPE